MGVILWQLLEDSRWQCGSLGSAERFVTPCSAETQKGKVCLALPRLFFFSPLPPPRTWETFCFWAAQTSVSSEPQRRLVLISWFYTIKGFVLLLLAVILVPLNHPPALQEAAQPQWGRATKVFQGSLSMGNLVWTTNEGNDGMFWKFEVSIVLTVLKATVMCFSSTVHCVL